MKRFRNKMLLLAAMLVSSLALMAQTEIRTQADLKNIANNLSGSYILKNDITLSGAWTPIVDFTGTLDGAGYIISGLSISDTAGDNIGFFSSTKKASIKNLGIKNATVVGGTTSANGSKVGILIGEAKETTIERCFIDGGSIEGREAVGALVGQFTSSGTSPNQLINCYSSADVIAYSTNAGGLIGAAGRSNIMNCYSSGTVWAKGATGTAGGIVGANTTNTTNISNCVGMGAYVRAASAGRIVGKKGSAGALNLYANYGRSDMKVGYNDLSMKVVEPTKAIIDSTHGSNITLDSEEFTSEHPDYTTRDVTTAFGAFISGYQKTVDNVLSAKWQDNANSKSNRAAIWCQAIYWDMAMNYYNKTGKAGDKTRINKLYSANAQQYVGFDFHNADGNDGWFIYDDIMWWTASFARGYKYYDDKNYLKKAEDSYDRVLFGSTRVGDPGSWDHDGTHGGMFWRWEPTKPDLDCTHRDSGKAACINFPTVIAATTLYETTGEKDYYDQAKAIYDWAEKWLIRADGYVFDMCHGSNTDKPNPNGADNLYNSGTAIGAAVRMYKMTGEKKYLNTAIRVADYVKNTRSKETDYFLPVKYGEEQGIYAAIFAQYMGDLINECGQYQYLSWMRYNINSGWGNRITSGTYSNITCPDFRVKLTKLSWDFTNSKGENETKIIRSYDASAIPALMITIPPRDELAIKGNLSEKEFYAKGLEWDMENVWKMSAEGLPVLNFDPSTGKENIQTQEELFTAYSDNGTIIVNPTQEMEITAYSISGSLVDSKVISGQEAFNLPIGIYLLKATIAGQSFVKKVINK